MRCSIFVSTGGKARWSRASLTARRHIKSTLVVEKAITHADRPEATRCFNSPMAAIEECLCNAIYHRGYEIPEPVEVCILSERSIRDADLGASGVLNRRYRNRRIGEFLKELDMTTGGMASA